MLRASPARALLCLWRRFWFEPISPSSVCLFRILFGLLTLVNGIAYLPDLLVWFGAEGAAPIEAVFSLTDNPLTHWLARHPLSDATYVRLVYTQLLASCCLIVGWQSRLSLLVWWIIALLLRARNPAIWHQCDVFLRLAAFPLLFAPLSERYSLDSWLRRGPRPERFAPWAQRLLQLQMCAIYFEGFFEKMSGLLWRDGIAVYYALHFPDGMRHEVPAWMDQEWIYNLLTYFTFLIELSLWFLIWFPPLRYVILAGGIVFHLGIQYFLHLDYLEYAIMIYYVTFIPPEDLDRLGRWLRGKR
ncbi:MAG: HTTM domain-containing protein [Candidatus Eremiobacteraeota bacterium]|nr:HTTM domain-containing protein [Candidatus Eremiobacteraeota bacterium]MCW5867778.1 HTTM domain-containing protein [Candidatus Eremiobacteraeota bacterium]